jgi:hypothetical protein
MPQRYFLDTSALVSRYLRSATGYAWMGALCDPAAGNVIGLVEITGAELAATFNQMVRGGQIRKRLCDRSLVEFWQQVDGREYHIVPVTSALVRRAADLCGVHSLKGYDAVQLAQPSSIATTPARSTRRQWLRVVRPTATRSS